MSSIEERIKEQFQVPLEAQQEHLEKAFNALNQLQDTPKQWAEPKKEIENCVLPQLNRWLKVLQNMRRPIENVKRFKKERKRVNRAYNLTITSWPGMMMRGKMFLLFLLNLIKKVIVYGTLLGAAGGLLYLIYTGIMKLING